MTYPSIRIEGATLSPDILDRLDDAPGQRPVDFGLDSGSKEKDEIVRAWIDAQDCRRIFQRKSETLRPDSSATGETCRQWMTPLLGLLGYSEPAGLDRKPVHVRLPLLFGEVAKSDEEIRLALGLEKGQLKVWLAAAVEQGFLERRKKPMSYALPRQQVLC